MLIEIDCLANQEDPGDCDTDIGEWCTVFTGGPLVVFPNNPIDYLVITREVLGR